MSDLVTTSNLITILSGPLTAVVSVYLSNKVSDYKEAKRLFNSLLMETRHNREICEHYVDENEDEQLHSFGHNFEFSAYEIFMSDGSALTLDPMVRDTIRTTYTGFRNLEGLAQPGATPGDPKEAYRTVKEVKKKAEEVEDGLEEHIKKYGYTSFLRYTFKGIYHKIRIKYRIVRYKVRNRNSDSDLKIEPNFR